MSGSFAVALNEGNDPGKGAACTLLGATGVRLYEIPTTAAVDTLDGRILEAVKAGRRPAILFHATPFAEMEKVGNAPAICARYAEGGAFWQKGQPGEGYGHLHVKVVEYGNEWSYRYQWQGAADSDAGYLAAAKRYALAWSAFYKAVRAAAPTVTVTIELEDASTGRPDFIDQAFALIPGLAALPGVAFACHPYGTKDGKLGGEGFAKLGRLVTRLAGKGVTGGILWLSEVGFSVDAGRKLNHSTYPVGLTYAQAAAYLTEAVEQLRALYAGQWDVVVVLYKAKDQAKSGATTDLQGYFGGVLENGTLKPEVGPAMQALLKKYPLPVAAPPPPPPPPPPAVDPCADVKAQLSAAQAALAVASADLLAAKRAEAAAADQARQALLDRDAALQGKAAAEVARDDALRARDRALAGLAETTTALVAAQDQARAAVAERDKAVAAAAATSAELAKAAEARDLALAARDDAARRTATALELVNALRGDLNAIRKSAGSLTLTLKAAKARLTGIRDRATIGVGRK